MILYATQITAFHIIYTFIQPYYFLTVLVFATLNGVAV